MSTDPANYRPPADERIVRDRIEPVRVMVRTRWLYAHPRPGSRPGRHAFSRSGEVVASDVPSASEHAQSIWDHVYRAVAVFGDDADLVIEVRRAQPPTPAEAV
ncbi:hypothetical protein GCM10027059_50660 [Myceligenerans halotolerans]